MTATFRETAGAWRLWAFVATTLVLGPILSFGFGSLVKEPILWGFPVITAVFLALSVGFGLWSKAFAGALKFGVVLWSFAFAWMAPIFLIFYLNLYCGVLNGRAGHYVCGL